MKFWLVKINNHYNIQAITDTGKKFFVRHKGKTIKFELNQKRQAKVYIKSLNPDDIVGADDKIKFDDAFDLYVKSVLSNELNTEEYNRVQVGYIKHHIQPYINKTYLHQYLASDFEGYTLKKLLRSKKYIFDSEGGRSTEIIGKKVVKECVGEFKKFLKFCKKHKWKVDLDILDFEFNKNTFGDTPKDIILPSYADVVKLIESEKNLRDKCLYRLGAETGCRTNEAVAICEDDIDYNEGTVFFRHSLDRWSNFRANFLKTRTSRRRVEISDELLNLFKIYIKSRFITKVKDHRRVFNNLTKDRVYKRLTRVTKRLGIKWQGGFSVFRKFNSSLVRDQQFLTDKQFMDRYGWLNLNTFGRWYQRDLDMNRPKRKAAINNLIRG